MKNLQNLYNRFPLVGLCIAGLGIFAWAFSVVFLIVLITVAVTG